MAEFAKKGKKSGAPSEVPKFGRVRANLKMVSGKIYIFSSI